jgi:acetate kinase
MATLLTVNTGSSSLKASLYSHDGDTPIGTLRIMRIGLPGGHIHASGADGQVLEDRTRDLPGHEDALEELIAWLRREGTPAAIGHRVVHGGPSYSAPQLVNDDLLATLRSLVAVDPEHLPQAIAAIERLQAALPDVPQVACFDTAFHRTMPRVAQIYALPRHYLDAGVIRYGFHGLSCEYILDRLRTIDPEAARGRVVVAHLGNGASMTAVLDGRSVETTMGFTPTGGLVMGTRPGDLDPGVILYLEREKGLGLPDAGRVLNEEAGMLAVSGTSADMQDLLVREATDPHAAEAVALFCHTARKFLGAFAAVLGGLDTLVFTGGIGEHAAAVRERVCAGLDFLGIRVDGERNRAHGPVISPDGSPAAVRVIPTNEDLMIARHVREVVGDVRYQVSARLTPDI